MVQHKQTQEEGTDRDVPCRTTVFPAARATRRSRDSAVMPVNWKPLAQSHAEAPGRTWPPETGSPLVVEIAATETFQGWGDCGIDGGPGSSSGVCGEKKQRKMLSEQGHGVLGAQGHQEGDTGPPSAHRSSTQAWLARLGSWHSVTSRR